MSQHELAEQKSVVPADVTETVHVIGAGRMGERGQGIHPARRPGQQQRIYGQFKQTRAFHVTPSLFFYVLSLNLVRFDHKSTLRQEFVPGRVNKGTNGLRCCSSRPFLAPKQTQHG